MLRCDRLLEAPVRYVKTESGLAAPCLRLKVRPGAGRFAVEHGFQVDTGSDVALGLAPPLRNWLQSAGARPGRESVSWGPAVKCETYKVQVLLSGGWVPFEAFFPLGPFLGENLVGRPLLDEVPLCLRPAEGLLHVSRPR